MPVAEYPMISVSATNPRPLLFYQMPEQFQVSTTHFSDGGVETMLQAGGNGIKTWVLEYEGMTEVEAAVLDSHSYSAKLPEGDGPSAYTFNFRDRDTGTLYSGVRYLRYERVPHTKKWSQARRVVLVKYP